MSPKSTKIKPGIQTQFKDALRLTAANWAALADREEGKWQIRNAKKLPPERQSSLTRLLSESTVDTWLCGALSGGNSRSVSLPMQSGLGTPRLFAFPVSNTSRMVLVGAERQSPKAQRVWRTLASTLRAGNGTKPKAAREAISPDLQAGLPYDLPRSLEHILAVFTHEVPCSSAWIAIRRGDILDIEAVWNTDDPTKKSLPVDSNKLFQQVHKTLSEVVVLCGTPGWESVPEVGKKRGVKVWICLPLLIGHRMIGVLVMWRQKEVTQREWRRLHELTANFAPSVEMAVTFFEMGMHLRRLGMFNDFALTVSSAQNLEGIARRVFDLLARIFGTELITLYLLSTDARMLREFYNRDRRLLPRLNDLSGHPMAKFLSQPRLLRLDGDVSTELPSADIHQARSGMIVPLRYRGQSVGVLTIESVRSQAFSQYDEHLIGVIASHLAGLVEYGRLREEAEGRARSLGLIHEVVQQVIGLNDKYEIAQITADLLSQYFDYEVTAVLLGDKQHRLTIHGFGGKFGSDIRKVVGRRDLSSYSGITGHVFLTGESQLVNDTRQNRLYEQLEGWNASSEVCVALKDNDHIFGIIDIESSRLNAFTRNDLIAIESLAGILAAVVSKTDQYQRLQEANRQLRQTQIELKARMEAQRAAEHRLVQTAKLAALGEMAAGIAHELNNPLTTVTGFSELILEEMPEDVSYRTEMEMVQREAHRAGEVVRRLLDFSRQGERTRSRADANELVEDVIALTQHLIHTSGIQLVAELGGDLPWVSVDRNQIKQVLLNLIHNALQAMPNGGRLYLSTAERSRDGRRWITMSVRDTGVGIDPKDQPRIFEPFFTTRRGGTGTGLGLSVTYGIITDHGGFIDVESEIGKGSLFTVWLPL